MPITPAPTTTIDGGHLVQVEDLVGVDDRRAVEVDGVGRAGLVPAAMTIFSAVTLVLGAVRRRSTADGVRVDEPRRCR